jgi:hypothetical protein
LGKTCGVCQRTPKYSVKTAGVKYLICDKFDDAHVGFLKENKIFKKLQQKFENARAAGIVLLVLSISILIFFMLGLEGSFFILASLALLLTGIIIISVNQNLINKMREGERQITTPIPVVGSKTTTPPRTQKLQTIPDRTENSVFCPSCGFQNKSANIYCGKCGYKLQSK